MCRAGPSKLLLLPIGRLRSRMARLNRASLIRASWFVALRWLALMTTAADRVASKVSRSRGRWLGVAQAPGLNPEFFSKGANYGSHFRLRLDFNSPCRRSRAAAVLAVDGRSQLEGVSAACPSKSQNGDSYRGHVGSARLYKQRRGQYRACRDRQCHRG